MDKPIKKMSTVHMIRRFTQIASFILLPGLFTSTFYAIKEIYVALLAGSFTFSGMAPQILILMATILVTIFMGRFFCGFLCSFGSMGDFLWFLSQKTIKPRFKIGEKGDTVLKLLKYGILLFIIIGIWTLNLVSFDSTDSPWTIFGMYASIGNWPSLQYLLSIGGMLLLLIIIGSLFIERFFCKYLCPLGAVFAIVSKLRIFRIKKNREKCGSCRMCTNKCTMGIPLYRYDRVDSGECINCFACVDNCPRNNVKANPTPAIASAVSVATICGLVYVGNAASSQTFEDSTSISSTVNTSTGTYTDGTYTGTAAGFRGDITVSVTVENGNITDITVLSYNDDEEYFSRAESSIISSILESQDVNVDAVSGATFSSNGIMNAVANALSITQDTNTESNNSTSDIPSNNTTDNPESEESATNSASNTDSSESVVNSDSSSSDEQVYVDGTYTGTGSGFRGDTEVSVTVSNGKITDITVSSYMDDEEFFTRAQDTVISEIIDKQDVNVDAVSGATFSSNGIMEAVANAISVTYTNTNDTNERGGHGGFGGKR